MSSLRVVVFPAPFGPSSAKMLPAGTCRSRPTTASVRPNRRVRPKVSIAYPIACPSLFLEGARPVAPNRGHEVLQRHAGVPRLDNQPLGIVFENRPVSCGSRSAELGHDGSDTRPHREQSFVGERAD